MATASDDFNRANETPLAGNWTGYNGGGSSARFNLSSNTAVPSGPSTDDSAASWNATTFGADQFSQAALTITGGGGAGQGIGLILRSNNAASPTMYRFVTDHNAASNAAIVRFNTGTPTTLTTVTQAWSNGDIWRFEISGFVLTIKLNGAVVTTFDDSASGSKIASGSLGIGFSSNGTSPSLDNWQGGDLGGFIPGDILLFNELAGPGATYGPYAFIEERQVVAVSGPLTFLQDVFATSTTTATMVRQVNKAVSATATTTATIVKQVNKLLSATVSSTASLLAMKVILLAMSATVTTTASIVKQVNKIVSSTVTTTTSIVKQVNKLLQATATTTATLTAIKVILRTMTATVTTTATITNRINKALSSSVTTTASIVKRVNKNVSATATSTATLLAQKVKLLAMTATATTTATMVRQVKPILSTTVSTTATITKRITHSLTATSTVTATMLATFGAIATFLQGSFDALRHRVTPSRPTERDYTSDAEGNIESDPQSGEFDPPV